MNISFPVPRTVELNTTLRAIFAEFFATTMFVWMGTGAAVSILHSVTINDSPHTVVLPIALAFGFAIVLLVSAIGHLSGGHINPAVTFAFMLLDKLPLLTGVAYIVVQLLGGIFGSLLVYGCVGGPDMTEGVTGARLGVNAISFDKIDSGNAFLLELMGTFVLVFTVLNSAVDVKKGSPEIAPIAIGFAVGVVHIILIPFTGCGINPARSFGPMVMNSFARQNEWSEGCWVYYTAPFVGSLAAAYIYQLLFANPQPTSESPVGEKATVRGNDDDGPAGDVSTPC